MIFCSLYIFIKYFSLTLYSYICYISLSLEISHLHFIYLNDEDIHNHLYNFILNFYYSSFASLLKLMYINYIFINVL